MQALILAGGEATRLRPLTSTIPKPVVPLVNRPFIAYMFEWLRSHGVEDVILSCGFMADGVRRVLGDGSGLGIRLRYVEEPTPLGTAGALKFAEPYLEPRFLMLNGDVLTDIDLSAQLTQHERTAATATLALVSVDDPSAYGLVRCADDGAVSAFVEKPEPGEAEAALVNAGAYVLEREVLELIAPAPAVVSIERDVFPRLVGRGLYGYAASGYWLDIGTPERYLEASFDILEGALGLELVREIAEAAASGADGVAVAPTALAEGSNAASSASLVGPVVLGRDVTVGEESLVTRSVLLDGVSVGAHTTIDGSIVGPRARIGDHCQLGDGVVLGEGVTVGTGNALEPGARIFPGVNLPERAISS